MCNICTFLQEWEVHYDSESYPPHFYRYFLDRIERSQIPEEIFDYLLAMLRWKIKYVREASAEKYDIEIDNVYYSWSKEKIDFERHRNNTLFLKKCLQFKNGLLPDHYFFSYLTNGNKIFSSPLKLPVFLIHVLRPNEYPIIDQHVWRAMKKLTQKPIEPYKEPSSWEEYKKYTAFYEKLMKSIRGPDHAKLSRDAVDRALWAFGKSLKTGEKCMFTQKTSNYGSLFTVPIYYEDEDLPDEHEKTDMLSSGYEDILHDDDEPDYDSDSDR